jgi:hypothetical protein
MKTVILVANDDEAKQLSDIFEDNVEILITGEGRSNVIKSLTNRIKQGYIENDDRIINVGYVGSKGLKKGSVLKINSVEPYMPSETIEESKIDMTISENDLESVSCYTADDFVESSDSNVIHLPSKCVIDMELYYIALMFPNVISYKIVSDTLNYNDYKKANFEESWNNIKTILTEEIAA